MIKNILLLILFISLCGVLYVDLQNTRPWERTEKLTVIVTPFGSVSDDNYWTGEAGPFMNVLENQSRVTDMLFCEDAYIGTISGEPVLIVISGIGKVKSATCVSNVLEKYPNLKEVIVSGTSGISSNQGARVGDVCINSIAGDFDAQHYSADQPETSIPQPSFWEGNEKQDLRKPNGGLAFELLAASETMFIPDQPSEVDLINDSYQTLFRTPRVFGMNQCVEISGDLFWHDTLSDKRARQIGSELLNSIGYPQTLENTVIVTSMESAAVKDVVDSWNLRAGNSIIFAYVRGASNFDHPPLNDEGLPLSNASQSLENGYGDTSIEYAAQMAAQPILRMLKLRSEK